MPPKSKFTEEEVIAAALGLVRERGEDALTARELGAKLGSSARPIFTLFSGMDEVFQKTERAARDVYNRYMEEGLKEPLAFRGAGRAYIRFAQKEPQLFRLLFMRQRDEKIGEVLPVIDENYAVIRRSVTDGYAVTQEQAEKLYRHLWVYTHGIASLIATRVCTFSEEEINGMIAEVCRSLIVGYKSEGSK